MLRTKNIQFLKTCCLFFENHSSIFIIIIPITLSAVVQAPILSYYFKTDDFLHLFDASNSDFLQFVLKPHGGHLLFTFYSIFYLLYNLFSMNAEYYFAIVFITHLLNVFLIFHIIKNLTKRPYIAVFGSSLWGMCTINHGALSWFSVYGFIFTGTCLLWIFFDFSRLLNDKFSITKIMIVRWYLLLFAAATSIGVGFAIVSLFAPVVWLFFNGEKIRLQITRYMLPLILIFPIMYVVMHLFYNENSCIPVNAFQLEAIRPVYFLDILKMVPGLLSYGVSSLHLGPYITCGHNGVVIGPLQGIDQIKILQISYGLAAIFFCGLIFAIKHATHIRRCQFLSFLLLLLISYGIIALGRTWFIKHLGAPIWMGITIPRYHYIGSLIFSILSCLIIAESSFVKQLPDKRMGIFVFIWILATIVPYKYTAPHIILDHGKDSFIEYKKVISAIHKEIYQYPVDTTIYIKNRRLESIPTILMKGPAFFPHWAALFIIAYSENTVEGRKVYFIEENKKLVACASKLEGTRISEILITPDQVPVHRR